jgi:hypothetical protein
MMFALSLARTIYPKAAEVKFFLSKAMWVANALNEMVTKSMEWGADFIVYLSNDVGWNTDAIVRLVGHNKQVVGGWASGRCHPFKCHVADYKDEEKDMFHPVENPTEHKGLERIVANGGEMLVFRNDIFNIIPYPWFSGVSMINPKTGRMRTEDYFFAEQCKKHGIEMWVDWDVQIEHVADGMTTLGGKLMAK